jgi:hypothetical protein
VADFKADTTGLSTFDPAVDTVANVTTVGTVTNDVTTDAASRTASQADVSSLATQASVNTIDTEVGQIKAKTDQLTFTVANQVDSNALTGGGGDDAATIYSYFTTSSRQDTFKATGFSTHAPTDIVSAGPITTLSGAVVNVDTVDTCTTNSDMISVSSIANGVWDEAQTGHVTVGTFGYYLDSQISGLSGGGGGTDWSSTEREQIRYRLGVDGTATAPSVNSPDISQKSDISALNDFNPAVDVVASVTTVGSVTNPVVTDTASRDASKADVSALATSAEIAALNDPDAAAIADAVWDEQYNQHTAAGTFGKLIDTFRKATTSTEGTVSGTPSTTAFDTSLIMSNDNFNDQLLVFTSGSLLGVSSPIIDSSATNGRITLQEALPSTPSASDEFIILSDHIHPILEIQSGLATSAEVSTLSTFDPAVDAVANVTTVGSVTGSVGSVTTPVTTDAASRTASQADLTSITSDVADVKSVVDSILLDTGTDGVVISTAQAQAIADEVLSRSVSNVETAGDVSDTALEHTLATIVLSILNSQRSAGNWTIYKTDNATTHVSKTLTLDPAASPVTRVQ